MKWARTVLPNPSSYCSGRQTRRQKPLKLHSKSMPSLAAVKKGKEHDLWVCIMRGGRSHASPSCFLLFPGTKTWLACAKTWLFVPRPLPQANIDPEQEHTVQTWKTALSWNGYTFHHPPLSDFVSALIGCTKTALRKKQQLVYGTLQDLGPFVSSHTM